LGRRGGRSSLGRLVRSGGDQRWGKGAGKSGVGVTGWVRAAREDILSGAVLGVWSTQSKRGWSGLSTVARVERGGAAVRGRRGCWG
jgi:hypothetical protein